MCIYIYTSRYVCIYAYTYVDNNVSIYVCMYVRTYVCMYTLLFQPQCKERSLIEPPFLDPPLHHIRPLDDLLLFQLCATNAPQHTCHPFSQDLPRKRWSSLVLSQSHCCFRIEPYSLLKTKQHGITWIIHVACAHAHPDLCNLHGMRHMHTSDIVNGTNSAIRWGHLKSKSKWLTQHSAHIWKKCSQETASPSDGCAKSCRKHGTRVMLVACSTCCCIHASMHDPSMFLCCVCCCPVKIRILESCAVQIGFHLEEIQHNIYFYWHAYA